MRSRSGTTAAVVVAVLALVASTVVAAEAGRVRDERDEARLALASASQSAMVAAEVLGQTTQSRSMYKRLSAHRGEVVRGLREQVEWDKSHLLDCWTALVRVIPPRTMHTIFGTPLGYLGDAARDGGVLAHYVRRCASDAVP